MLARECKKELTEHIIPFWDSLEDDDNGGFYRYVGNDLTLDKNAPQGVILPSRILWLGVSINEQSALPLSTASIASSRTLLYVRFF